MPKRIAPYEGAGCRGTVAGACEGRTRRGVEARGWRAAGVARLGSRESAGLPEQEELFQAGENAREDASDQGVDQGVEAGRQAGARLPPQGAGLGGGDRGAEGWFDLHWLEY